MPDEFIFDGTGLDDLARDLRHGAQRVRREIDVTLVEIGAELTAKAKLIASRHSKTVAGTIRMRAVPGAVIIAAGSDQVAIAALWETGNKGSKATDETFRHPVFGNRSVFVDQQRYPFLRPALTEDRRSITRRMEVTWDRALEPYRLRPEGI